MDNNPSFDAYALSKKLKDYFKDNIKMCLKSIDKLLVVSKNDIFYEINVYDVGIQKFISTYNKSSMDNMIVEELCSKKVIDLAYGKYHFIAKTDDNKIYCWGNNHSGQLGRGTQDKDFLQYNKPELNEFLSDLNIIKIKCGERHSLALTKTGEVYAWGANESGQIGSGCFDNQLIPIKLNCFENEKIIDISCGFEHSLALTQNGLVFSWGSNLFGQLGRECIEFKSNTPTYIEMNEVLISKISCGTLHSLLLSNDGFIYAFGNRDKLGHDLNDRMIKEIKPFKLKYEKSFIDIASHWTIDTSLALSVDNIYHLWAIDKTKHTLSTMETKLNSFNEIFTNLFAHSFEVNQEIIEFTDFYYHYGYYKTYIIEMEEIGSGGYGTVYKVMRRDIPDKIFAIKKIIVPMKYQAVIVSELHRFNVVNKLSDEYVANHSKAWFEKNNDNEIIIYIQMIYCDKTLEKIIEEIRSDSNFQRNEILTPIGYYIASLLFIEILESVQYLHGNNIIHRDLNPNNIMLKKDEKSKRFIHIIDFGLIAIHEYAEQTHSSNRGNIEYMAPEAYEGRNYDTKADIYSLGILLKELFQINYDE
jgi:hypothetical protein